MIEDVGEFKKKIKKVTGKRKVKITNSYGNNEAYLNYINTTSPEDRLSSQEFRSIINRVNELLAENLLDFGHINLPVGIGKISIYARDRKPKMVNNKLVYDAPIDWNKTLELWATDPESKVAKTLIKMPPGLTYTFKYHTSRRSYTNRKFFEFSITRSIKNRLKKKVHNKEPMSYVKKYNII